MSARSRRRGRWGRPPRSAASADPTSGARRGTDLLVVTGLSLLAIKLVAVVLAIDPAADDAFALPKSAVGRALGWPLLVLTAAQILRERPRWPRPLVWTGIAYVGVVAVATAFAVHPYTAAFGAPRRFMGLTQVLDGAGLALGVAVFVRSAAAVRVLVLALAGPAAVVAGYAVAQSAGIDPVRYVERFVGSTIGNPGATAGYALIVAAMTTAAALSGILRSRIERVAAAVVCAVCIFVVVLTGARGPLLAIAVASLVLGAIAAQRWPGGLRALRDRPALGAAAAITAGLLGLAVLSTPAGVRLAALATGGDLSTTERGLIYGATLEAAARRPILGVGMDSLVVVYPSVRPTDVSAVSGSQQTQTSTHSWFLHQVLGAGLAGTLAAFALVIAAFVVGWPALRAGRPAAAIGIAGLAAFLAQGAFNISHVVTDALFWTSIGSIGSAAATPRDAPRPPRPTGLVALAIAAAVVAGSVAAFGAWGRLEANRAVRASNVARAAKDLVLAERAALRAIEIDPGRADHWNVLGLARAGRPELAAVAFLRATEAAPYEPVYLLNLAREEAAASSRDPSLKGPAQRHAGRAAELDANNPRTHLARSQVLALTGDLQSAAAAAERAIELEPSAMNYDWASRVYTDLGRPTEAIERLRMKHRLAYPGGALPLEDRVRLADLHVAAGDAGAARALFGPPQAGSADASCQAAAGSVRLDVSTVRPRCIRIAFIVEAPLLAERGRAGSVLDPAAYLVGDAALPAGATVAYDGGRLVTIQLPAGSLPPGPRTSLIVRGITDAYGNPIRPDPARLTVE